MANTTLHEAIAEILSRRKNRTATTTEISAEIEQRGAWSRKTDGRFPRANQINARVRNHPALFEFVAPGLVRLIRL